MTSTRTKLSCLFSGVVITLSACSHNTKTGNEMTNLQRDFNHYKHSAYIASNLKPQAQATYKQANHQTQPNGYKNRLSTTKSQLQSRKKRASSQLANTISNNGLYTPSPALSHKIMKLGGQYENWLINTSSLNAVLAIALKNNLDIKSSQQQVQASLAKYDQVSFLDDMLAQYATFTKDLKLTGSTQKHNKSVSSGFPFPGLLALKASIVDQAIETSRLELKQTAQDVITKTRIAYHELQFAEQEINILRQNIKLLKIRKQELENSYSTNTAELSGVLTADIEIEKNRNKLQIAKDKQQAQQARLNALLNLSPTFTLGKLDRLKAVKLGIVTKQTTKQLLQSGKQHRVEIASLESELKKIEYIIQLSEKRFYPDFSAGYSRFESRGSKSGFSNKPKIKNSNFFAKNDAYLTETKLKYQALQSRIRALQTKTEDEIQQALFSYQTQKRTHALYQHKVLPKARASLEIAKNLYETGETSYLKVIDAEKMILEYRLLSLKAVKGVNVSAAKVMRLIGK